MAIIVIKHALLAVLALSSLSLSSSVVDAAHVDVVRRTTNSRGIRGSATAATTSTATAASATMSSGDRVRNLGLKNAKTSDKNKKKTSDKKNKKTVGATSSKTVVITKTPTPVINTGGITEKPILNTDTISSTTDAFTGTTDGTDSSVSNRVESEEQEEGPAVVIATTIALEPEPIWDLRNCPSLYPQSGNDCVMIDGFDFKKCFYYEYGLDVLCQCSTLSPIWICTGTIIRDPVEEDKEVVAVTVAVVVEQEVLEVAVEIEEQIFVIVDDIDDDNNSTTIEEEILVIVEDIEDDNNSKTIDDDNNSTAMISEEEEEEEVGIDAEINVALLDEEMQLLCPVDIPLAGDECGLNGFDTIPCCYTDPEPIVGGTILCTCTDDFGAEVFTCMRGSLSLCTV
jgi:hypothetical protein